MFIPGLRESGWIGSIGNRASAIIILMVGSPISSAYRVGCVRRVTRCRWRERNGVITVARCLTEMAESRIRQVAEQATERRVSNYQIALTFSLTILKM